MEIIKQEIKTTMDIQELIPLVQEIWHEVFVPIIGEEQVRYMLDTYQSAAEIQRQIQEENMRYFAVFVAGERVGYTAYKVVETSLFISKLYLKQECRGKGIATDLFHWLEETAKNHQLSKLSLRVNQYNQQAIAVYEHKGFRNLGSQIDSLGNGFLLEDYLFEKRI